jgi:ferredoxin-NADP reductase
VSRIAGGEAGLKLRVAYWDPSPADVLGRDYHVHGSIGAPQLAEAAPGPTAMLFLAGPTRFVDAIAEAARGLGIDPARIRSAPFGP